MNLPHALLDAGLRGMVVALMLLVAVMLLRDRPWLAAARLGMLMMLGLVVQVLGSTPALEASWPRLWQVPLVAVAVANAPLFWLFVRTLFDDGFRPSRRHAALWGAAAVLGGANCAGLAAAEAPWATLTVGLQRLVPLLAAAGCIWAVLRHWQADLVEGRRRLRVFVLVAGTAYTLVMAGVRLGAHGGRLDAGVATLDVLMLLLMAAVTVCGLLQVRASDLFPAGHAAVTALPPDRDAETARGPAPPVIAPAGPPPGTTTPPLAPPHPATDPAEQRLAAALQHCMQERRAYREEGLTLAALATRLAVPEYRLRRLINGQLGQRNFNAYVNGLRLAEAQQRLIDPAEHAVPMLSIALDVGFGSIGPFNRAFKARTGLTPTEYRRRHGRPGAAALLADS
ncbi:AraC family transcriptional regulator [Pseudorhodoferax sp.]|uniref:AraC family transcriptional regulator n=1 Tax=Pseudorhodoferax sp. TaxID=1993553 RepID=UPI002DD623A7|nr:AraC family transcriptional regulator [Pseudorhodoferax sp.]